MERGSFTTKMEDIMMVNGRTTKWKVLEFYSINQIIRHMKGCGPMINFMVKEHSITIILLFLINCLTSTVSIKLINSGNTMKVKHKLFRFFQF